MGRLRVPKLEAAAIVLERKSGLLGYRWKGRLLASPWGPRGSTGPLRLAWDPPRSPGAVCARGDTRLGATRHLPVAGPKHRGSPAVPQGRPCGLWQHEDGLKRPSVLLKGMLTGEIVGTMSWQDWRRGARVHGRHPAGGSGRTRARPAGRHSKPPVLLSQRCECRHEKAGCLQWHRGACGHHRPLQISPLRQGARQGQQAL